MSSLAIDRPARTSFLAATGRQLSVGSFARRLNETAMGVRFDRQRRAAYRKRLHAMARHAKQTHGAA